MKHAVSSRKSTAESKTAAPSPTRKSQAKNPPTKKTAEKISSRIVTKKPAKKIGGGEPQTAKKKLTATKKAAPTLAKKSVKTAQKVSAETAKPSAKSIVKTPPKKLSSKTVAAKPKISLKKKSAKIVQPVASKKDLKIKAKAKTQKPEIAKNSGEKIVSPSKSKIAIAPVSSKKTAKSKTESKPAKPVRASKSQTAKTAVLAKKPQVVKTKLTASAKNKVAPKKPLISAAKSQVNPKIKSKPIAAKKNAAPKVSRQTAKTLLKKAPKPKSAAPKKSAAKSKNIKIFALPIMIDGITRKIKSVAAIQSGNRQIEKEVKTKAPEIAAPVEETKASSAKPKKAKPIGSAIFRGVKERYDFKVFELGDVFEPIPAVYIISKRKTDRRKKGHHALICIGETASVSDELKRHRKGKCVKKHQANVVSLLPEADEKARLKIENDLKAAHSVVCNLT